MCVLASCMGTGEYEYPFQDPSLSPEKRADNLLSLLTVDEKLSMLMENQPAIERLGGISFSFEITFDGINSLPTAQDNRSSHH